MTYTDTIEIGPAPAEESCAQVGEPGYAQRGEAECERFINLIREKVGVEPAGARLVAQWSRHDLGSYCEVVVKFDRYIDAAMDYAFTVESTAPTRWA